MTKKEYFYLEYPKDDIINLDDVNSTLAEINQIPKDSTSAYSFFKSSSTAKFACFENPLSEIKNVVPLILDSESRKFKIQESRFSKNLFVFPLLTDISNAMPKFSPPPPPPSQNRKLKAHSFPCGHGVETELLKPKGGRPSSSFPSFFPSYSSNSTSSTSSVYVAGNFIADLLSNRVTDDDDDDTDHESDDNEGSGSNRKNDASNNDNGNEDEEEEEKEEEEDDTNDKKNSGFEKLDENVKKRKSTKKKERKEIKKEVEEGIGTGKNETEPKKKKKKKEKESKGVDNSSVDSSVVKKKKRKRDFESSSIDVVDKKKKNKKKMDT